MTTAKKARAKVEKAAKKGGGSKAAPKLLAVPAWLSQSDLGRVTGLSRQSLAELAREPDCPREQRRGWWVYPWPAWNEWRIQRRVDRAMERSSPSGLEDARKRKLAAEAELAELELAREQRRLITLTDARQISDAALDRVAARLRSVPNKEAYRFVALSGIPAAVGQLQSVIDAVMAELSGQGDDETEDAA